MKKTIKTDGYLKKFYTKLEIRYIKDNDWNALTPSMVPGGCTFVKNGWSNRDGVKELTITSAPQADELRKAMIKRVKTLRAKMPENLEEYYKCIDAQEAAERRAKAKAKKIGLEICEMLKADGWRYDIMSVYCAIRKGENYFTHTAKYGDGNGIVCEEVADWDGYSKSCKYPKINRHFTFTVKRGWHVFKVGGLITFAKSAKIDRNGMACEWIEQGKAIADIKTVSGFLVRGEHIEAKSLREAKAISAEHRAMQMARILSARKKSQRRAEQKENGTLRITFTDSLNAGNCRPGTSEFKKKYEEAIGHEAKSISIADLRKYGKLFGVGYYAEKVITYALNH